MQANKTLQEMPFCSVSSLKEESNDLRCPEQTPEASMTLVFSRTLKKNKHVDLLYTPQKNWPVDTRTIAGGPSKIAGTGVIAQRDIEPGECISTLSGVVARSLAPKGENKCIVWVKYNSGELKVLTAEESSHVVWTGIEQNVLEGNLSLGIWPKDQITYLNHSIFANTCFRYSNVLGSNQSWMSQDNEIANSPSFSAIQAPLHLLASRKVYRGEELFFNYGAFRCTQETVKNNYKAPPPEHIIKAVEFNLRSNRERQPEKPAVHNFSRFPDHQRSIYSASDYSGFSISGRVPARSTVFMVAAFEARLAVTQEGTYAWINDHKGTYIPLPKQDIFHIPLPRLMRNSIISETGQLIYFMPFVYLGSPCHSMPHSDEGANIAFFNTHGETPIQLTMQLSKVTVNPERFIFYGVSTKTITTGQPLTVYKLQGYKVKFVDSEDCYLSPAGRMDQITGAEKELCLINALPDELTRPPIRLDASDNSTSCSLVSSTM